jgi:hypothetical protein
VLAQRLARVGNGGVVDVGQLAQHDAKLVGAMLAQLHVLTDVAIVAEQNCVGEARRNANESLGEQLEASDALRGDGALVLGASDSERADRHVERAREHNERILGVDILLAEHKRQKPLIAHRPRIAVGADLAAALLAPIAAAHIGGEQRCVGTDPSQ